MRKRLLVVCVAAVMLLSTVVLATGCGQDKKEESKESKVTITLATTTSTKDSGLLDEILPKFTEETGWDVDVISVGSGEAIKMGENGEADVLLVHSPADEKAFVKAGNADEDGRLEVMYNDFVVIGPKADAAGVAASKDNAITSFKSILNKQATFISRGDDSGTHKKELSIWKEANLKPQGDWYVEAAAGMGDVITMADEKQAYTLADRATWLSMAEKTDLKILCEKDPSGTLNNQYGVICVNPEKNDKINHKGAKAFQKWIVSDDTQKIIGEFGVKEYGEALFIPNAK